MRVDAFENSIQKWADEEELNYLGLVSLDSLGGFAAYQTWLSEGRHAGMKYMAENLPLRRDPALVLPGARNAVLLALPYYLGDQWNDVKTGAPRFAQYARFRDYHRELKARAEQVGVRIVKEQGGGNIRVCVDSVPILERHLASKSARGFIGKNTCFIDSKKGSFFLLAEILTDIELDLSERVPHDSRKRTIEEGCGACKQCQIHCPTGALTTDYSLDSKKCLSYWTIEHRGAIPEVFWPWMAHYVFGCDICQLVCPYNLKLGGRKLPASIEERTYPALATIANMSQREYEHFFGGTPATRAKRNGLRRNALIAMFVTKDPLLPQALSAAENDAEAPIAETIAQIRRNLGA